MNRMLYPLAASLAFMLAIALAFSGVAFGVLPVHAQVASTTDTGTTTGTTTGMTATTTTTGTGTGTTTVSTASSTSSVISGIVATPTDTGATISWQTDQAADSQVLYGLDMGYGSSTTLDTTQVTAHSQMLSGLSPNTLYHFQVVSNVSGGMGSTSMDQTFTTLMSSSTATSTGSLTPDQIQAEIEQIRAEIAQLIAQILALQNGNGTGSGSGTGTTTPSGSGSATIDQNGGSYGIGGSIDFVGRGFAHEENVTVSLNGSTVATAHADGGGNFSTGSFALPMTAGTYQYAFNGASGDSASATITVH